MLSGNYRKIVAGIVGAWFAIALTASALGFFRSGALRLGWLVAVATLTPIVAFIVWFGASAGFRQWALSLNPRSLTLAQAWRINGFIFVLLYSFGMLPGIFALPAGWGDIAVGASALVVARVLVKPEHKRRFVLWQVLGMADLVMAVSLGVTAGLLRSEGPTTEVMTVLPLSLVPTFIVPLLFIFHIICIAQARQWTKQESIALPAGSVADLRHPKVELAP
jgi:hypothetical protein